MLSEFGIGESKNTAYYYLPVLADAESAEFIQFERIAGSDDTFKRTIREKLAKVVLQEYDRIQLVKQRKIDGAVSIDNFDRNGLIRFAHGLVTLGEYAYTTKQFKNRFCGAYHPKIRIMLERGANETNIQRFKDLVESIDNSLVIVTIKKNERNY